MVVISVVSVVSRRWLLAWLCLWRLRVWRWIPRRHAVQQLHKPAKRDAAALAVVINADTANVRQRVDVDADVVHRQDLLQLTEADEAGAVAVVTQESLPEVGWTPALLHLLTEVLHQLFATKIHLGRGTGRRFAKRIRVRE